MVGVEKFVMTTGRAMARAHGYPNLRVAAVSHEIGVLAGYHDPEGLNRLAQQAAPQLADILLGR